MGMIIIIMGLNNTNNTNNNKGELHEIDDYKWDIGCGCNSSQIIRKPLGGAVGGFFGDS
jgi:hypothetical protein